MNTLCILKKASKILSRQIHSSSGSNNVILVEKLGHITTIGINRPKKRNCIDLHTATLLKNAIYDFEKDNNSFVAVIYGTGGNFCSGIDFSELENLENRSSTDNSLETNIMDLPTYIHKPTVAAISGYAVAEGLELALLCDLRVIEDTAILGFYGRRFGIPITNGATVRLQAIVGLSRALDIILTGRSLNAEEAFQWGVANRIVACGTALGQAINLASSLVKFPQECLNIDRLSTYNAAYKNLLEELLRQEKRNSKSVPIKHLIEGSKKFLSGLGRHGKTYNLSEKTVRDWEKDR